MPDKKPMTRGLQLDFARGLGIAVDALHHAVDTGLEFFRVHNSQLVRMSHVESLNVRAGTLTLRGGRQVPFAVRKRDEVRRRLAALMVGADPEATAWTQAAESGPEPVG